MSFKDKILLLVTGFDTEGYDKNGYNKLGFNRSGYDKKGYDKEGYNRLGYDVEGYNSNGYDTEGYDKKGYDKEGYDKKGYDKEGYNKLGYDKKGYDREGYNKKGYNKLGYDKSGYDKLGYDEKGIHKLTRTKYNKLGYDVEGYDSKGYNIEGYNRFGYDKEGYNRKGFNLFEYNRETDTYYDRFGYDMYGYNKDGFNWLGYNKQGFDIAGFDQDGYNLAGYDKYGYDREGYNIEGCNRQGYYKKGFDWMNKTTVKEYNDFKFILELLEENQNISKLDKKINRFVDKKIVEAIKYLYFEYNLEKIKYMQPMKIKIDELLKIKNNINQSYSLYIPLFDDMEGSSINQCVVHTNTKVYTFNKNKIKILDKNMVNEINKSNYLNVDYIYINPDNNFSIQNVIFIELFVSISQTKIRISRILDSLKSIIENKIANFEIINYLLSPSLIKKYDLSSEHISNEIKVGLNEEQSYALNKILTPNNHIMIIQGPPGTGKTHFINRLITDSISLGAKTIVVSSSVNLAVHNVVEKIDKGKCTIIEDTTIEKAIYYKNDKYFFNKDFLVNIESDSKISSKIITYEKYIIVAATTNRILDIMENFSLDITIDLLIIDEASKCSFFDLCIPFTKTKKIVMIGDYLQLDYQLNSYNEYLNNYKMDNDVSKYFSNSIFRQTIDNLSLKNSKCFQVFKKQYRMDYPIFNIVKKIYDYFPNLSIETAKNLNGKPVRVINVLGEETVINDNDDYGIYNISEANFIVDYLCDEKKSINSSIGVITGYRKQAELIKNLLRNKKLPYNIQIGTIDEFQGREYDCVLLSLVRTKKMGFMYDLKRMNVALSRAKKELLILGNFEAIKNMIKKPNNLEEECLYKIIYPLLIELVDN